MSSEILHYLGQHDKGTPYAKGGAWQNQHGRTESKAVVVNVLQRLRDRASRSAGVPFWRTRLPSNFARSCRENDVVAHLSRMQAKELIRLEFTRSLNAHISLGNQAADRQSARRSQAGEKSRALCHPPDTVTWDTPLTPLWPIFPMFARRAEP
jgi:hypothetical protein